MHKKLAKWVMLGVLAITSTICQAMENDSPAQAAASPEEKTAKKRSSFSVIRRPCACPH